jgi:hypothetical protein
MPHGESATEQQRGDKHQREKNAQREDGRIKLVNELPHCIPFA